MNVQCFIPDWPGEKQHAGQIYDIVQKIYPTTILNDGKDFFNAQWEKARNLCTADILLWIMADAILPENFPSMCQQMHRIMSRGDIGWYAPDVDWTSYIYDRADLAEIEPGVCVVPNTDSILFGIRADVAKATPFIDPEKCYMWGMDFTAIVTAERMNLKTVRDYNFKVGHPKTTGYDIDRASLEMKHLFENFPKDFQDNVNRRIAWCNRLKRIPE
jgi:hypothetical protein